MMPDFCLAGKILKIDLTDRRMEIIRTEEVENGFWGGRGLNQSLLLDLQEERISPFDPKIPIIFGPGRLVGTEVLGAVRMNIDSKNIFTGGIGSSNIGGKFPCELKSAGYDHIIISGTSETPIYLWICDEKVEIRDATNLWGKLISNTERILKTSIGDKEIQYVAIGPAGENLVWPSAIIGSNARAAARCGLGAIMGSKKVKAIVARGPHTGWVKTSNPDRVSKLINEWTQKLSSLPSVRRKRDLGTVYGIPIYNDSSAIIVRNFADEYLTSDELSHYLPEQFGRISLGIIKSCTPCPIYCQHLYEGSSSKELPYDKLEAQTVLDFGTRLELTSPEDILTCHALCSQYGLDIDNTASVICWAIDCFEKGILKSSDTDGLVLRWGDPEIIFRLIKKLALREGIGELLSQGSYRASLRIGKESEKLSYTVKRQDLAEPIRSCKGWALGVAVSPRGGTHTRGAPTTEFQRVDGETGKRIWDVETAGLPKEYEGKPKLVIYYERLHAIMDSLGLCHFISNWSSPDLLGPKEIAELCSATLGVDLSEEQLMDRGERILTLEKIYNLIHTNLERKDDYPPEIFFNEPIRTGPFTGEKLDKNKWDKMLTEYYCLHDWDPQTSFPKKNKLTKLGFEKYIHVLKEKGKIR